MEARGLLSGQSRWGRAVVVRRGRRCTQGAPTCCCLRAHTPQPPTPNPCRYALLALRHGNVKNQAETITTLRANAALAKDIRRLDAAAELLRFEEGTPTKAPVGAAGVGQLPASLVLPVQGVVDGVINR